MTGSYSSLYLLVAVMIIMVRNCVSSSYRSVDWIDLAWFSSLSSKHLCLFGLRGAIYTVSQKNLDPFLFEHNFIKFCLFLIILSLLQTENICPKMCNWSCYFTWARTGSFDCRDTRVNKRWGTSLGKGDGRFGSGFFMSALHAWSGCAWVPGWVFYASEYQVYFIGFGVLGSEGTNFSSTPKI